MLDRPSNDSDPMDRLTKRAEFLAVARGARSARRGFVLQALGQDAGTAPRCGFTVTKKVGNAVVRNRIRRRLWEAMRLTPPALTRTGVHYVLVGRPDALVLPFEALMTDLATALRQVHGRLAPLPQSGDLAAPDAGRTIPHR